MNTDNPKQTGIKNAYVFGLVAAYIPSVLFTDYIRGSKQDGWLIMLIAAILVAPLIALYLRIFSRNPGMNLFEALESRLGRGVSMVIGALYLLYALLLCALDIRGFTQFTRAALLPKTPILYVTILLCLLCLYLQRRGTAAIGRFALFSVPLVVIIMGGSLLLSADVMKLPRLLPVASAPATALARDVSVLGGSVFGEVLLPLAILPAPDGKTSHGKAVWLGYALAALTVVITVLRAVAVLGGEGYDSVAYAVYSSYSVLHIGNFVNRFEALISVCALAMAVCRISAVLQFINLGAAWLTGVKNKAAASLPIVLVCAALSLAVFQAPAEKLLLDLGLRYAAPFFLLLIPLLAIDNGRLRSTGVF